MNEKVTTPLTQGVHHVGLTVPSLEETNVFFVETLGFKQVGEVPDYPATLVSDGTGGIQDAVVFTAFRQTHGKWRPRVGADL